MVLEKNTVSGEDDSIREVKARERGVLLPVLLWWIRPKLVTTEEKGKSAAVHSAPPPAAPNVSRVEKPERRVNGWLTAVGLSWAHPSVQLQLATSLPLTGWGSCPGESRAGRSSPQVSAQPTHQVSQRSSSIAKRRRQGGKAKICRPLAHSPALCIAGRW